MTGILSRGALFGLTMFLGAGMAAQAQEDGPPERTRATTADNKLAVVENAIDAFIRPGYGDFHESADVAVEAMESLCTHPGGAALATARDSFADLAGSWSRIEFVRFGPVLEDNRLEKILFFPDRRGIALRQIQGILGSRDESATTAQSLAGKSVAVQGLGALEFVLFGTDADTLAVDGDAFRCSYGRAIARNLAGIAADLDAGWADADGIAARLTRPNAADPAWRSATDSLQEIVGIFIHGFEVIRDLRLRPAMGESAEDARPNLLLFPRSELALASLRANFAGMRDLFVTSEVVSLLPAPQTYLGDSIRFEFANADRTLAALAPPLADVAAQPEQRQELTYLLIVTDSLQSQFADQLSPSLGLSTGFSALDGD
ncbi:imelysin family protein [Aurantimonas sp. A2-1-M11]|uniref:imelysin family protein n=1 Tax=Aurantimonas sp. A2-1-M11 TaxID=3113712 RepID=UPI002F9416DB